MAVGKVALPGLVDSRKARNRNSDGTYTYYPNPDFCYGPYESKQAAWEALSATVTGGSALVVGKTVGIMEDGKIVEYWFESACASVDDLVKKGGSGSGSGVTVDTSLSISSLNPIANCAVTGNLNNITNRINYIQGHIVINSLDTARSDGLWMVEHSSSYGCAGLLMVHVTSSRVHQHITSFYDPTRSWGLTAKCYEYSRTYNRATGAWSSWTCHNHLGKTFSPSVIEFGDASSITVEISSSDGTLQNVDFSNSARYEIEYSTSGDVVSISNSDSGRGIICFKTGTGSNTEITIEKIIAGGETYYSDDITLSKAFNRIDKKADVVEINDYINPVGGSYTPMPMADAYRFRFLSYTTKCQFHEVMGGFGGRTADRTLFVWPCTDDPNDVVTDSVHYTVFIFVWTTLGWGYIGRSGYGATVMNKADGTTYSLSDEERKILWVACGDELAKMYNSNKEYPTGSLGATFAQLKQKTGKLEAASITYAELKALRDAGNLVVGRRYRITDYQCTTTQKDTQSAGHQFDIIVTADSASSLNENAHACLHSGDTYFSGNDANLGAWELKYSLDNDTDRFLWASTSGKGVIYWMKDEWNNECPYDFKNIMFKRFKIDTCSKSPDLEGLYGIADGNSYTINDETPYWCYTFCMIDNYDGESHDLSVEQNKYISDEDNGLCYHIHDNVFKSYYNSLYDEEDDTYSTYLLILPSNVFVTDTDITCIEEDYSYGEFYGFYNNTFGNDCYNNTFGNNCCNNTFGNGCGNNTFGNSCFRNTFGNGCGNNTFGNDCYNNTFGNYFQYNTFGNNCCNNTFGNNCYNNTFGNYFQYNTFGNGCGNNTFGNDCCGNTFGNNCCGNTFGNNCCNNTFGNNCYNNTFGNNCYNNTFGNSCFRNTFGNYMQWCSFEDGVQYIATNCSTGSSAYLQNMHVLNGTKGTSSANELTINMTANRAYCTHVGKNTSGTLKIWCPADLV